MEFRLEPTPAGTLLSTETRILATDPWSRRFFAVYWFLIRASSAAIRREVLRVVARGAESHAPQDAQRLVPSLSLTHETPINQGCGSDGGTLTDRSTQPARETARRPVPRHNLGVWSQSS